jgi:hypothetical protein
MRNAALQSCDSTIGLSEAVGGVAPVARICNTMDCLRPMAP